MYALSSNLLCIYKPGILRLSNGDHPRFARGPTKNPPASNSGYHQSSWLSQWCQHVSWADQQIQVSPLARNVKTPLNIWAWNHYLSKCSTDPLLSKESQKDSGSDLSTKMVTAVQPEQNLQSALEHPHIVSILEKRYVKGFQQVIGPLGTY